MQIVFLSAKKEYFSVLKKNILLNAVIKE